MNSATPPRSMKAHALRESAELQEQGLSGKLIRVHAGRKTPMDKGWPTAAGTNQPQEIGDWFDDDPGMNYGIRTGEGLLVVDVDMKNGVDGERSLVKLLPDFEDRYTRTNLTPSGGSHLLYRLRPGESYPSRAGKLAPGLDVRCDPGLVVGPGGRLDEFDEPYSRKLDWNDTIMPLPDALRAALGALHGLNPGQPGSRIKGPQADAPGSGQHIPEPAFEDDSPENIARFATWLEREGRPAVQHRGGDDATYHNACKGRRMGLSADAIVEAMEHWNAVHADPPWSDEELRTKAENAHLYGQGAQGDEHPGFVYSGVKVKPPIAREAAGAAGTWDEPDLELLADALGAAPAFPRDVLGPALPWCEANARAANAPFDYGAVGLLTIAAALIGNARAAAFDANWEEPANLWAALIGPPSSGKSPSLDPLQRLLTELEGEMARGFKDELRAWEGEAQRAKAKRTEWESRFKPVGFRHFSGFDTGKGREGAKGEGTEQREGEAITTDASQILPCPRELSANVKAAKMPKRGASGASIALPDFGEGAIAFDALALPADAVVPDAPVRQRVTIGNITVEETAALAEGNPKGLLVLEDELAAWFRNFDRYAGGAGGDAAFWLKGYGARPHLVDRRKLAKPIRVPRLSICILGGLQPDIAAQLLARQEDGLAARFLLVYPEPIPGFRRAAAATDHAPMKRAMRRLWSLSLEGPPDDRRPVCCPLSAAGADEFEGWWNAAKGRAQAEPGFMGHWLGKAGGLALRLALVLEHLWWAWIDPPADDPLHLPPETVSFAATRAAMRLIEDWAEPMAGRVAASTTASPNENDAATLARWLRRTRVAQFNAREARRSPDGPGGRLNQSAAMNAACGALVEAALIRRVATEWHKGRRPNDFEVNPLLFEQGIPP